MLVIKRCLYITGALLLLLVAMLGGCGGDAGENAGGDEETAPQEVRSVTTGDMRVDFVKLLPDQQRQVGDEVVEGFTVTLRIRDLKGRSINAENYSFLAPLYAEDNLGTSYESILISVTDKDSGNNMLPPNQNLVTLLFTPPLGSGVERLDIDFKIKPVFHYQDTVFKELVLEPGTKQEAAGVVLEDIMVDPELKQVSISFIPAAGEDNRKDVSLAGSYLLLSSGEKIPASGVGVEKGTGGSNAGYELNFPYHQAMSGPVDLVISWIPREETWDFPLRNIQVAGFRPGT